MGHYEQGCSSMSIRLLLAANEELESVYLTEEKACIALALSRNYRLLAQTKATLPQRYSWVNKTKYWWQEYLKHCTGQKVDLWLLSPELTTVFEPVKW